MDFLKQLLPGGQQQQNAADGAGLLADWQAYSGQPGGDVESGGSAAASGGTAGSQIAKKAEEVGSSITGLFRTGYTAVTDGLGNIQQSTTGSLENTWVSASLPALTHARRHQPPAPACKPPQPPQLTSATPALCV